MINVTIGTLPGRVETYALEDGATIKEVLDHANFSNSDNYEIRVNGRTVTDLNVAVDNNSEIRLLKQIAAGI